MSVDLTGKRAVVTGANTGIGKVTAQELMRMGAHVVFACRSEDKARAAMSDCAQAAQNGEASFLPLDLSSLAHARQAAETLLEQGEPIDLLINNAGLAGNGITQDGFEINFGVNHLGHFVFTELLLEHIKETKGARIVNVASKAHYRAQGIDWDVLQKPTQTTTGFPEYSVSKLANVLYTKDLAARLQGSGVTTYSLHPGVVATDVWRRIPRPFSSLAKLFMISEEEGAQTTLYCATSPKCASENGLYYDSSQVKTPSKLARDEALVRELHERSLAWSGL